MLTTSKDPRLDRVLQDAVDTFLRTGEGRPILLLLRQHPEMEVACTHAAPDRQPLQDLVLQGRPLRLWRCAACDGRLTLEPA